MRKNKIIYSINIEDVQNVAQQALGRDLMDKELRIVEDKIGDRIDWFEAIASVIEMDIKHPEYAQSN